MLKFIQPFILTLVAVFLVSFVSGYQTEIYHSPAGWSGSLLISSVATVISAIALFIVGLPLHLILKKWNKEKLSYYISSGAILGFIIVFLFKPFGNDAFPTLILQGSIFSMYGAFTAGVFWFLSRKKNA